MGEITISLEEYRHLLRASSEAAMLRKVFKDRAEQHCGIYGDEFRMICAMLGIEVTA